MIKLSDSELQVMSVIWEKKIITSSEIIQALNEKKWNPSTIRTFIKRLLDKKAIIVCKKNGKQNIYQPNIDKQAYIQEITEIYVKKYLMLEK